jgi:hypothetical protein
MPDKEFGVYTVGHETNYDQGLVEQGETFEKLGRQGDYPGGFAVKTPEDARRLIKEQGREGERAVYGLAADWDTDTAPSENGWWRALVNTSRIVRKITETHTP